MKNLQEEGIARYLKACRHDIAHLNGASEEDVATWVADHLPQALVIYNEASRAGIAESGDVIDAAEQAFVAVKRWAQGEFFRG